MLCFMQYNFGICTVYTPGMGVDGGGGVSYYSRYPAELHNVQANIGAWVLIQSLWFEYLPVIGSKPAAYCTQLIQQTLIYPLVHGT